MSIFSKKLKSSKGFSPTDELVAEVQRALHSNAIATPGVTSAALAFESITEHDIQALNAATDTLSTSLESIAHNLNLSIESGTFLNENDSPFVNLNKKYTKAQLDAGIVAGTIVGDIPSFLRHKIDPITVSTEAMHVNTPISIEDGSFVRPAMEAYDERENRNAAAYTIAYNMQAARQDEFNETFWPTIVVSPDNVGFSITVRLNVLMEDLQRQLSGALDNFKRTNIIRAVADHTILKNEMTRIVPVYRQTPEDSRGNFAASIVAAHNIDLEGEIISTAPLATGKKFSLLGISQTDTLLKNGVLDITDSIDPAIKLENIYVTFTNVADNPDTVDKVRFNVENLPLSTFSYSTQNNYRLMTLNFETNSLLLNASSLNVANTALEALDVITTGDLLVRIEVVMSGSVDIQRGDTVVFGNRIALHSVQNASGQFLAAGDGSYDAIKVIIDSAVIGGYDLKAYRTNSNRRQRGQIIDTTYYTEMYNVPLRSPISAIHPETQNRQGDAGDLTSLITATRIRTSNAGITALINYQGIMKSFVDARDSNNQIPDIMGAGRHFVIPKYSEEALDMTQLVDSLSSTNRPEDIQNAIVNKIRDHVFRLYTESEYKAAADALNDGISNVPVAIIGTDPIIGRYLNITGDLRTLGGMFDVRIVTTLDYRVRGKIFITFGVFDENRNVEPNPLNFGNMAWSPEVVVSLPISRNGQISREISVSPRFTHIQNLPILGVLTVTKIEDVLNKVNINTNAYNYVLTGGNWDPMAQPDVGTPPAGP